MKFDINGYKGEFGVNVRKLSLEKFEKLCLGLKPFKELLPKQRALAIKEAYGYIQSNVKETKGFKFVQNLSSSDKGRNRNNPRPKQGSTSKGKDEQGTEAKA